MALGKQRIPCVAIEPGSIVGVGAALIVSRQNTPTERCDQIEDHDRGYSTPPV